MLNILYPFPNSLLLRLIAIRFMRLPVPGLALFAAVVGCLASGALALGWRLVAKRTRPRVLSRHISWSYVALFLTSVGEIEKCFASLLPRDAIFSRFDCLLVAFVLVCDTSLKRGECLVASNSPFKVRPFCEAEKTKESKIDTTRQRTHSQVLGKPTLLLLRRQLCG